ncbi:MAG TPA: prepilin peptidase [Alphaproteobacteria bacterium]|jgi:prepilin peptidase CpaA|nr:prepilin peptidase [Alphaproteobacteria bacterium]
MMPDMLLNQGLDRGLLALFCALLAIAAASDLRSFRIPNRISAALLLLFPLHVLASPTPIDWPMSLAVGGAIFAVGFGIYLLGWAGGGDVKLLAASALWTGPTMVGPQLLSMALAGGVLALAALGVQYARRYAAGGIVGVMVPDTTVAAPKVPYGAAIAVGGIVAILNLLPG